MNIAVFNAGLLKYPIDHQKSAGFADNLAAINALATRSDGYLWHFDHRALEQLSTIPAENDTAAMTGDEKFISNMSLWRDVDSLYKFVYKSAHGYYVKQRHEWFECAQGVSYVLWTIDKGKPMPYLAQGFTRLAILAQHGPTKLAFDFKSAHQFVSTGFLTPNP